MLFPINLQLLWKKRWYQRSCHGVVQVKKKRGIGKKYELGARLIVNLVTENDVAKKKKKKKKMILSNSLKTKIFNFLFDEPIMIIEKLSSK